MIVIISMIGAHHCYL